MNMIMTRLLLKRVTITLSMIWQPEFPLMYVFFHTFASHIDLLIHSERAQWRVAKAVETRVL